MVVNYFVAKKQVDNYHWVYDDKFLPDGKIDARRQGCGGQRYRETYDMNYFNTSSFVAWLQSV